MSVPQSGGSFSCISYELELTRVDRFVRQQNIFILFYRCVLHGIITIFLSVYYDFGRHKINFLFLT